MFRINNHSIIIFTFITKITTHHHHYHHHQLHSCRHPPPPTIFCFTISVFIFKKPFFFPENKTIFFSFENKTVFLKTVFRLKKPIFFLLKKKMYSRFQIKKIHFFLFINKIVFVGKTNCFSGETISN